LRNNKISSEVKALANRKNALKSTGPKTAEGKNVVKWNALKHGLLTKEIIVNAGYGYENKKEYEGMIKALQYCLQPVGIIEEILVEKIAVAYWRLRRSIRCETGEIQKRLDNIVWDLTFARIDEFRASRKFVVLGDSQQELLRSSKGLDYLIDALSDIRAEIAEARRLTENAKEELIKKFCGDKEGFVLTILIYDLMASESRMAAEGKLELTEKLPPPDKCCDIILEEIDGVLSWMKQFKKIISAKEKSEQENTISGLALPDKEVLDKLHRYETSIERQFYRALHELQRIQSARKGEKPPAPIAIDLDISKEL
jgi:hypothetical protein